MRVSRILIFAMLGMLLTGIAYAGKVVRVVKADPKCQPVPGRDQLIVSFSGGKTEKLRLSVP